MLMGALVLAAVEVVEAVLLHPLEAVVMEVKGSPSWSFTHENLCSNP
jgi:hypothetical protein